MGQSLDNYLAYGFRIDRGPDTIESPDDVVYDLDAESGLGLYDYIEKKMAEHLLLGERPEFCPTYDDGVTDRMSYSDKRAVQETNYEAWKKTEQGIAYDAWGDALREGLLNLEVDFGIAGTSDYGEPIFYVKDSHISSYWGPIEIPGDSLGDAPGWDEYLDTYIEVMGFNQVERWTLKRGWFAWSNFG